MFAFLSAPKVATTDDVSVIRSALHSPSAYLRGVAINRLHDLAELGKVPAEFSPDMLRVLDLYWDNNQAMFLILPALDQVGTGLALHGFDARLVAAAKRIVEVDHAIPRSLAIDLVDGVHTLITPDRRSYTAVALALFHVLMSDEVGGFRELYSTSYRSTPLQRAKAFAILTQICPCLTQGFESDQTIQAEVVLNRAQDALKSAFKFAGREVPKILVEQYLEGSKVGGIAGKVTGKAVEEVQGALEVGSARDQRSLRLYSRGEDHESEAATGITIPHFDEMSHAQLENWIKDQVNAAAREVLDPSEAQLRLQWRNVHQGSPA